MYICPCHACCRTKHVFSSSHSPHDRSLQRRKAKDSRRRSRIAERSRSQSRQTVRLKSTERKEKRRKRLQRKRGWKRSKKSKEKKKIRKRMRRSGKSYGRELRLGGANGFLGERSFDLSINILPSSIHHPSLLQAQTKLSDKISTATTLDDKLRNLFLGFMRSVSREPVGLGPAGSSHQVFLCLMLYPFHAQWTIYVVYMLQ